MNKISFIAVGLLLLSSCNTTSKSNWTENAIEVSAFQLKSVASQLNDSVVYPRSTWTNNDAHFIAKQLERAPLSDDENAKRFAKLGKLRYCSIYDWTSGFFPGSLWYAYELTKDEALKNYAINQTNKLDTIQYYKNNHDIGFMMNCSYGNALRLSPNDSIPSILIHTADNLCSRFNPEIGCIRSWDFGSWNYPVIIDNMMNLDLLFNAYRLTGNKKYYDIAVKHAYTTMRNHFRSDYTCWHVVSYNNDGTVERKQTFQGKNDDSRWARGQAWAVYGYTSCYRETNNKDFLDFAQCVADMIMANVDTKDAIPYWDYDAPHLEDTPRDASAAAITASALLELSTMVENGKKYFAYAEKILQSLSSPTYLAAKGDNLGFILKHSTGSLPHNSEVDTPINYADYYYLEALTRYLNYTYKN